MSRAVPFRRICPKKVQARIDKAARSRFFVVQELGPMAFIIEAPPSPAEPSAATDAPDPPVNTTSRKYKVSLGSTQSCSCSQFLRERELCVHVLWLMLKVFKIPKDSETIYQISLVEREVTELLQCRRQRGTGVDSSSVEQPATLANETPSDEVTPRCIGEDDTCPICLEDITGCAASSLTYCRKSCGNWMHVKCVKVLVDHQAKSLGMGNAKCPLCRNDLGNIEDLKAELQAQEKEHLQKKKERSRKPHVHRGIKCRECHRDPIIGKCHRCTGCQDFFLCNSCFETAAHSEHAFTHKSRPSSPSKLSPRRVAPTLPSSVLSEMQSRELRDQDYEMLLTLDEKTVNQGNLPIHIVSSFPVEKATSSTWVGSTCGVCLKKVTHGEIIRKIPCSHGFHRSCVDRWLLQHRTTCPTCGLSAYADIQNPQSVDGSIDLESASYRAATYEDKGRIKGKRKPKKKGRDIKNARDLEPVASQIQSIEIVGAGTGTHELGTSERKASSDDATRRPNLSPSRTRSVGNITRKQPKRSISRTQSPSILPIRSHNQLVALPSDIAGRTPHIPTALRNSRPALRSEKKSSYDSASYDPDLALVSSSLTVTCLGGRPDLVTQATLTRHSKPRIARRATILHALHVPSSRPTSTVFTLEDFSQHSRPREHIAAAVEPSEPVNWT